MPTEKRSPTATAVEVANWNDPTKAYASDNTYAYSDTKGSMQDYYNYGFDIPAGSTINSVKVKVEHYESTTNVYLRVKVSWDGGVSWGPWHNVPNRLTETIDEVDVSEDTEWTPEKLNDTNFRVKIGVVIT